MEKSLWVVRDRITTMRACDDLLADAAERAIRELVVQVRGRGNASFGSDLEPRAEALQDDRFDPLEHLIGGGRAVGVRIHAWTNARFDIDPADPGAARHARAVLVDVVRRYAVEGLHYGHVRSSQEQYARGPEDHAHVTDHVRQTALSLRAARPGLVISAAVFPAVAREKVLQRWPDWARDGLVDLLCPVAYRKDTAEVARLLEAARAAAPGTRMWGGLMGYQGETALVRDQARAARDAGCEGAILFAYDPAQRELLDAFADA